jgi:hypothetical protein
MTKRVITVEPMVSVEDAARLLVEKRIGALPVTDGGTLVGIVTETDVLLLFVRAMGILEPSSRLDVLLPDAPASLGRMVHTIESAGVTVSSIVTLASPSLRLREAVVRVTTINPGPVIKALETEGYALRNPKRLPANGRNRDMATITPPTRQRGVKPSGPLWLPRYLVVDAAAATMATIPVQMRSTDSSRRCARVRQSDYALTRIRTRITFRACDKKTDATIRPHRLATEDCRGASGARRSSSATRS